MDACNYAEPAKDMWRKLAATHVTPLRIIEWAATGFGAGKARLLVHTNWVRTFAFLIQAELATQILLSALGSLTN